ncbi:MAG: HEPN domain-containing protein [Planctomycetes bacterium]|nr:HEPN domain-containing protein [Planctomycetota bacterium]
MTPEIQALWERAHRALKSARIVADSDPDSAASRAYYAGFYAVSALLAFEGKSFRKHSALEAAVHRDLVKSGRWAAEVGAAFSDLAKTRMTADHGALVRLTAKDAKTAIRNAALVIQAVRQASPEPLPKRIQQKRSKQGRG